MAKGLRRLAWAGLGLYLLYLLAANVFLNTALGPDSINRRPERFSLHWQRGLSLYPGHVVLWGAKLGGHSRRISWQATAGRLSGRIALLPLLRRELLVPGIDATDVRGELDLAHELPPAEPRPGGWILHFPRIVTDSLHEVRWGAHTLDLQAKAEFGMWKQLRGGALQIYPSSAVLEHAHWRQGEADWLREGKGRIAFSLPRHTRDEAQGWHRLALGQLALELDGEVPALAVHMDQEPRWRGAVRNTAGGHVQANLEILHGALVPGGKLALDLPLHASDSAGQHWTQSARLDLQVRDNIELSLHLPPPPAGTGRVDADLQIEGREVLPRHEAPPLAPRVSGKVDLQWRFDSLDWLSPLLAKAGWLHLDGAGEVIAAVVVEHGRIAAGSTLRIPDVTLQADVQGQRFSGKASADGRVDSDDGELRPRVDIAVQQFQVAPQEQPRQPYVRGRNLRLELRSTGRVVEFRDSLRARLVFDRAEVPDLRGFNSFLPGDALRFLAGSGRLSGDIALDAAGKVGKGRLGISARRAQLAASELEFRGDVDVDAQLARADLGKEEFVLDGTRLELRNVQVSDPERASAGGWWAQVRFDRGRLQWGKPLRIDTSATARMQDISLLLALFSRHKDYPGWVARVLDKGEATVSTRAQIKDSTILLEDLSASNDRFEVKARLRLANRRAHGDLYLRWARLGLGLELRNGEREFHLLKAAEWFDSQPRLLPPASR